MIEYASSSQPLISVSCQSSSCVNVRNVAAKSGWCCVEERFQQSTAVVLKGCRAQPAALCDSPVCTVWFKSCTLMFLLSFLDISLSVTLPFLSNWQQQSIVLWLILNRIVSVNPSLASWKFLSLKVRQGVEALSIAELLHGCSAATQAWALGGNRGLT